jgi:hypothetical protein
MPANHQKRFFISHLDKRIYNLPPFVRGARTFLVKKRLTKS